MSFIERLIYSNLDQKLRLSLNLFATIACLARIADHSSPSRQSEAASSQGVQMSIAPPPAIHGAKVVPAGGANIVPTGRIHAVIAGTVGNFVEWYDWALYAFLFPFFSHAFFPGSNESARLSTLVVFAISFLMRPLGGALLGSYGDRRGRKAGLTLTILLMGGASLLIAIAPTYSAVGWLAPAVLIIARLLQGLATGGEYGASSAFLTEWAKPGRRAFTASFQQISVGLGVLAASLSATILTSLLSDHTMSSWGWRLPFLVGAVASMVGLWIRRSAAEPEAFRSISGQGTVSKSPLRLMLTEHRRAALWLAGLSIPGFITYYMWLTYLPAFANLTTGISKSQASLANTISLCLFVLLLAPIAILCDRIGRRATLLIYGFGTLILVWPLLHFLSGTFASMLIVSMIGVSLQAFSSATLTPLYAELFPPQVRTVGIALPYALTGAIFGGTVPLVMELFATHKWFIAAPIYVMAACLVGIFFYLRMPETRGVDLTDEEHVIA